MLTGTSAFGGTGNALANTITGNIAANKLKGLSGNDIISGGGGRDMIEGGLGNDRLTGGADADSFVFNTKLSSTANVDRVTDFSVPLDTFGRRVLGVGESDRVRLRKLDAPIAPGERLDL